MAGGDEAIDESFVLGREPIIECTEILGPLASVRGPAITAVHTGCSTPSSARIARRSCHAFRHALDLVGEQSDSRHSVCIMRLSLRPARVSSGGGASGRTCR